MTHTEPYQLFLSKPKRSALALAVASTFIIATIALDFLYTRIQNSAFYLSESFLFSTYWLLFLPLLPLQWVAAQQKRKAWVWPAGTTLMIAIHLVFYPAVVWLLSTLCYSHSFRYGQTFHYGITNYLLHTILVYSLSLPLLISYRNRLAHNPKPLTEKDTPPPVASSHLTSLLVADGSNQKTVIATKDILYFSASAPYVSIHHANRNYLYTATLKSLAAQLDGSLFIRIHKSHLVNIGKVVAYRSRLNGDYDLALTDGMVLRVSRVYAAAFKAGFDAVHRLAP